MRVCRCVSECVCVSLCVSLSLYFCPRACRHRCSKYWFACARVFGLENVCLHVCEMTSVDYGIHKQQL